MPLSCELDLSTERQLTEALDWVPARDHDLTLDLAGPDFLDVRAITRYPAGWSPCTRPGGARRSHPMLWSTTRASCVRELKPSFDVDLGQV